MASKAVAEFALPNGPGLGVADTGQPWVKHRGSGEIKNGKAYFPPSNPGSIWTVDTGGGGGDAYVSCNFIANDGGGQALYFRFIDVNRWWRLAKRQYTYSYSYQSGTTDPIFGWVGTGQFYYTPSGGWVRTGETSLHPTEGAYGTYQTKYYSYDSRVGTYLGRQDYAFDKILFYQWRTVHETQTYKQIGGGQPIYSTGYGTATEVSLEKCVNGSVSTVKAVGASGSMFSLAVSLDKENISCFVNGTSPWSMVSDPTHKEAHRHGIGYAETSSHSNFHGIESFSAVPSVVTGYVPPLML